MGINLADLAKIEIDWEDENQYKEKIEIDKEK